MIDKGSKRLLIFSALAGALAVVIGAFGAHALVDKIEPSSLNSYKTGVSYQFYHTLASFLALSLFLKFQSKQFKWASTCFLIGILLFSGSIYLLTTNSITGIGLTKIWGPMTPVGGLFFILGWSFVFFGVIKLKSD